MLPSLSPVLLTVCWSVNRRPGRQERSHDLQEAVELLTPDVVARTRDMGDLELGQLALHFGRTLRLDHGPAVKVGGDQEGRTGDAREELLPGDTSGRIERPRARVQVELGIGPWPQLCLRPPACVRISAIK